MAHLLVGAASIVAGATAANGFQITSDKRDADVMLFVQNPAGSGRSVYFAAKGATAATIFEIPEGSTYEIGPFKGSSITNLSLFAASNTTCQYAVVDVGPLRTEVRSGKDFESGVTVPGFTFRRVDDPGSMDFTATAADESSDNIDVTITQLAGGGGTFRVVAYGPAGAGQPDATAYSVAAQTGTLLTSTSAAEGIFQATAGGSLVVRVHDVVGGSNKTAKLFVERIGSPFAKIIDCVFDAS